MKKYLALILAAVMLLGLLAGCGNKTEKPADTTPGTSTGPASSSSGSNAPAPEIKEEGINIRIGCTELGRFLEGLAPMENAAACTLIYDAIIRIDPWTYQPTSDCLEDWHWEDEHHFVMKLRDDVYFSNGDKADAEDLLFSYTNHEDRGSNYVSSMNIDFSQTKIVDDLTVSFYVTTPVLNINRTTIHLYNKDWCEAQGWDSEAFYNPVTSGPYYVDEFKYGDYMVLKPRDDYWNKEAEPAYVKEVYIKAYSDREAMMMDMELGNLDLCEATSADYSRYSKDPNKDSYDYALYSDSTGAVRYLSFGLIDFPELWTNKDARMAIAHGVDWEAVGIFIDGDMYTPANSIVPESNPVYVNPGEWNYDPALAQELLAKAGIDPSQKTIVVTIMDTPAYKNFSQGITYYLEEMGFKVEFSAADISAALAAWMVPGSCDFNMNWNSNGNNNGDALTSVTTATWATGPTWQQIKDPKFLEITGRCSNPLISAEDRFKANQELQQYLYDECLIVPICQFTAAFAYNKKVLTEDIVAAITFSNRYQLIGCYQASAWEK